MFNKQMSSARISVEWGFGKVQTYWPMVQFPAKLKILEGVGVQKHIDNAVFFTNCHNICYGGLCASYFDCHDGLNSDGSYDALIWYLN